MRWLVLFGLATLVAAPTRASESLDLVAGGLATDAQKCEAAKSKATGLAASATLTCYARAYSSGGAIEMSCLDAVAQEMEAAFAAAEARGGCAVTGDIVFREQKVGALVTAIVTELGPADGSTHLCAAKKATAAAKISGAKLKCWAAGDAKGTPVNVACLGAGEKGLGRAFAVADRKPGCAVAGDAAGVLDEVDAFVNGVRHGNGLLDVGEECDDGLAGSDSVADACRSDGRLPHCGDGVIDTGEAACASSLLSAAGDHLCIPPDIFGQAIAGMGIQACPSTPFSGPAPTCDGAPGCRLDVKVAEVAQAIDPTAQTVTLSAIVSLGNGVAAQSNGTCALEPPVDESCVGPTCDCAAGRVPGNVSVTTPIILHATCDAVIAVRDLPVEVVLGYTVDPPTGHPIFHAVSFGVGSLTDTNVADAGVFGSDRSDPGSTTLCGALRIATSLYRTFALTLASGQIGDALVRTAVTLLPGVF